MTTDKKSPKDADHIIIEAEATIDDRSANTGGDAAGDTAGDTGGGSRRGKTDTPTNKKTGFSFMSIIRRGFVALTFCLAVYALIDGWILRWHLTQTSQHAETALSQISEVRGVLANVTASYNATQANATLAAFETAIGQIDALNTRLFGLETRLAVLAPATDPAIDSIAESATPSKSPTESPSELPSESSSESPSKSPSESSGESSTESRNAIGKSPASPSSPAKPPLAELIHAVRSGAPFASVLASYLPHYSEAQALTVWAEQPPPDMESLWDEYDALVSAAGTASFNSTETSSRDRESGWWARLIAAASDSIRLTPLDQATRLDALTEAGEARDLIAAIGAAGEINTSGFAEWRAKADQRAQLDRVLAELSEDS